MKTQARVVLAWQSNNCGKNRFKKSGNNAFFRLTDALMADPYHARAGYTRFDQVKSMTLFPEADELTLIEEAHHIEIANEKGWWGEQIESAAQKRTREAYLEAEWEKYADSIGLMRK